MPVAAAEMLSATGIILLCRLGRPHLLVV